MKYILKESQLLNPKDGLLKIPFSHFNNNWNLLQKFLNKRNNPPYILIGTPLLDQKNDIESLGSLVEVIGSLTLSQSSISDFGKLRYVSGNLSISYCENLKSLGNLTSVGESIFALDSFLESLGNLQFVGGGFSLMESRIKDLTPLISVGKWLDISESMVETLGTLETIGENFSAKSSQIESLGNLTYVGGTCRLNYTTELESLGNLTYVGSDLYINTSMISDFGNLQVIGGDLMCTNSGVDSMSKLEVKEKIEIRGSYFN